jgi:hypothetical protein
VVDNILHQDNRSAILLERNGKMSSGKHTKQIAIRYFFVMDRIRAGEISPKWCPTGEMIADFLTKPLQGAMFWKFRDGLTAPQECVGRCMHECEGTGTPTQTHA